MSFDVVVVALEMHSEMNDDYHRWQSPGGGGLVGW